MNINVVAGANSIELSIADDSSKTIAQLINEAKAVLGLTGGEKVTVNGESATVSTLLKGGDTVEFSKSSGEKGSVTVVNGANEMNLDSLTGKTVKDAVVLLKGILGLTGDEKVKLNGIDATASQVIADEDEIEFAKDSGEKGSVNVVNGANEMSLDSLVGKTIKDTVILLKGILGLTGEEKVKLNGVDASAAQVIADEDELEFAKDSGAKGC